jgi:predicted transcriptional regulator
VYAPAQEPDKVQHSLLRRLMESVFEGSPMALVQTLVQHENLSEQERDEIRQMIDAMEDDQ